MLTLSDAVAAAAILIAFLLSWWRVSLAIALMRDSIGTFRAAVVSYAGMALGLVLSSALLVVTGVWW